MKFWKRKRKGAEGDNAQMSLIDHLRELRSRVIKCALVAIAGGAVSYAFYDQIYRFFTHPYCVSVHKLHRACKLYSFDPLSGFLLRMKVAGYGGLILAIPVILWQLWRFIMPGLYKNERRYSAAFVISSTGFTVVQRPIEGLVGLSTLGIGVLAYFVQKRRGFGYGTRADEGAGPPVTEAG